MRTSRARKSLGCDGTLETEVAVKAAGAGERAIEQTANAKAICSFFYASGNSKAHVSSD
jgi:hypothetical protein